MFARETQITTLRACCRQPHPFVGTNGSAGAGDRIWSYAGFNRVAALRRNIH